MGTTEGIGEKRFFLFENILKFGFITKDFNWIPSIIQQKCHKLISSALRKTLLEDDYFRVENEIATTRKWPVYNQKVLCSLPRRSGKSIILAMLIVALSESITTYPLKKPYRISVFSTTTSKSLIESLLKREEMINYVIDFLTFRGCQFHKSEKYNIKIEILEKGDNRIHYSPIIEIDFYPAASKNLRGVNSDLLIVDDAAYIDENFFNNVIIPILGIENTVLTMISSPLGPDNLFSRLLNLELESGEKVYTNYTPKFICRQCRASENKEIMSKCRHKMYLLPRWN